MCKLIILEEMCIRDSGKSTLARVIAGIIKPTSGRIYFDGEDITELGITERCLLYTSRCV